MGLISEPPLPPFLIYPTTGTPFLVLCSSKPSLPLSLSLYQKKLFFIQGKKDQENPSFCTLIVNVCVSYVWSLWFLRWGLDLISNVLMFWPFYWVLLCCMSVFSSIMYVSRWKVLFCSSWFCFFDLLEALIHITHCFFVFDLEMLKLAMNFTLIFSILCVFSIFKLFYHQRWNPLYVFVDLEP